MAKNQHRNLTGDALHNPKGFDGASNGTKPVKDGAGALDWITETQLPKALDYVSAQSAPPTEVTGDVYLIDTTGTAYDINTIAWQSGNTIRIAFNGSPDLSAVAADDYFITSGNGNSSNDGTFIITTVNDGSDYIEITNNDRSDATDDEATDAVGTGYYTLAEWDAVSKVSHVTFDGSIWSSITPSEGQSCYDVALGAIRVFDGTDWSSSLASGGITGSGTNNYLARWTPSGSALGDSVIQDNGSTVGVNVSPTSNIPLFVNTNTVTDSKAGLFKIFNQNNESHYALEGQALGNSLINKRIMGGVLGYAQHSGSGSPAEGTIAGGRFIAGMFSANTDDTDIRSTGIMVEANTTENQDYIYGVYVREIEINSGNTVSGDAIGVYLPPVIKTGTLSGTSYGVYQAGANDKNYFAGAMQFDTAAAAVGYVWTATDADGNGDWAAASGGGGGAWTDTGSSISYSGHGDYVEFKNDYFQIAPTNTSNTLGAFHNQVMYIGTSITAGSGSGSITRSAIIGTTHTIAGTSNVDDSLIVGNANTVKGGKGSLFVGNSLNVVDADYSFIGGNTINGGVSADLTSSFVFATGTTALNDTSTGLVLMGTSAFGFKGDNITGIGGDHYSTDATLSKHYAFGDRIRGKVSNQTIIGMGTDAGSMLQLASGAANGVHLGVASSRPSFGLVKATAKSLTESATETTGLMYLGTGLPVALNAANTGDGVFWIENVDTAPSATVANAGALYNDSNYLTWTKSIKSTGQIGSSAGATPNTETPSGTTETIDWDNGNYQILDLESASSNVTLTLSNPVAGFAYFIEIRQDSTTPLDVIFPSSVKFAGETAPYTLDVSTGANAVDAVSLAWNGSEYIASFSQNHG